MGENAPPPQDMTKNQILNLQLYNPQKPKPEGPQLQPTSFMPSFTTNPFFPPHMANMMGMNPMMGMMYPTVNLNKVYDIHVGGPADTHQRLNMIYEDVLPTKHIKNSYISLGDRITQSDYIRSVFFQNGDGDEIGFTEKSKNNLLAHIKFMDLNPYNTYRFSDNPYKGLPEGFLIYRSCYPIQRDQRDGMTICARNSMSVNVRVYKLTKGSYKINKQNKKSYADYDQWREVAYYEFIRERIIKKKLCPNFVGMHGYYTTEKSDIDFDRVTKLKNHVKGQPMPEQNFNNATNYAQDFIKKSIEEQNKLLKTFEPYMGIPSKSGYSDPRFLVAKSKNDADDEKLDEYTGSVLTILTESPTYSLYNWASKIYQIEGNIKKMVNTGYHSDKVWLSIIFQLIVALYVLQINKININNFSIKNNVFIKDVANESNVTNYWKYKINNVEFYVPNYGYLLQIDTNYKDLDDPQGSNFIDNTKVVHKLDGIIYDKTINEAKINKEIFDSFINCIDPNNFKGNFVSEGGVPPPQEILDILDKMHNEAKNKTLTNISAYLFTFMRQYMNNRIGTFLKEQEYIHVRKDDMRNAKPGQIVVLDEGNGSYRFVLFVTVDKGVATILTKKESISTEEIVTTDVPITSLFNFSRHEPIVQNYNLNEANITESAIIETYTIIE
jgi:hypothetical protein